MKENQNLDQKFYQQLERFGNVPERVPQAIVRGRARFLAQALTLQAKRKIPLFEKRRAWQFVVASLMVLVLIFGGGAGVVLAAQDDLPGEPFYPVKLFTEDVRFGLTNETQAKIDLLLGYVDVRVDEINQLALLGDSVPEQTVVRLENHIQEILHLAAGLEDDEDLHASLVRIQTKLEEKVRSLIMLGGESNETLRQVQIMLNARLRQVDEGLLDQQTFRNQNRFSQDDGIDNGNLDGSDFSSGSGQGIGSGTESFDQTPGTDHTPQKTPDPEVTPIPGDGGYGQGSGPF